jgi:hypothetical protein
MHLAIAVRAAFIVIFLLLAPVVSSADQHPWPEASVLQTQLYFGQRSADGEGVSEQAWTRFLAEIVTPRFPDGLTILDAYGQSHASGNLQPDDVRAGATKLLIIVHPNTAEAQVAIGEIKAGYRQRFHEIGVFHVDFPARIGD